LETGAVLVAMVGEGCAIRYTLGGYNSHLDYTILSAGYSCSDA
jgi:hypothetical protein